MLSFLLTRLSDQIRIKQFFYLLCFLFIFLSVLINVMKDVLPKAVDQVFGRQKGPSAHRKT